MKYILLAYGDERQLEAMSAGERDALRDACLDSDELLRQRGRLLAVEGLQPSRSAATVRIQGGAVLITDGPYAETKEQLIGVFVIAARDLNDAIQIAAQMPQVRGGPIEVRPLAAFDQP